MSENQLHKKIFEETEKEYSEAESSKIKEEAKAYILETLKRYDKKKSEKDKIEEELRILKLDIDDFRNGNFAKIKERQEKSKVANNVSVSIRPWWELNTQRFNIPPAFTDLTSGTYNTGWKIWYL